MGSSGGPAGGARADGFVHLDVGIDIAEWPHAKVLTNLFLAKTIMMKRARALAVVLVASTAAAFAAAQDLGNVDYVEECPVQNGFFADAVQCDRYYECKDGEVPVVLHTFILDFFKDSKLKTAKIHIDHRPDVSRRPGV